MKKVFKFLLKVFKNFDKDDADQMAAAISFYATFALIPMSVIAVGVAGFFYDREIVKNWMFEQLSLLIGPEKVPFWLDAFDKAFAPANNTWAIVISVVVLLVVTSSLFIQVKDALNRIFETQEVKFHGLKLLFRQGILPFLMVVSVGLLLILVILMQTTFTLVGDFVRDYVALPGYYLQLVFSTVILTGVFALLYQILAKVKLKWKAVLIGAVVAAVLLQIGIYLIAMFFSFSGILQVYSAAASMVAVLYWIFFSSQIFLFGAEIVHELNKD